MLMLQMTFLLQDAQSSPDRRITRRIGHSFHHLRGRGPAAGKDDVHDLALASAQVLDF
jgi:hypothetical protein